MAIYEWIAHYKDGSDISQYDENGKEFLFGDLDQDKIISFEVVTKENVLVKNFGVVLSTGQFFLNGAVMNLAPNINHYKHKLIYFRRKRQTVYAGGKFPIRELTVLGIETKLEDGKTEKNMFAIEERGVGIVRFEN